MLGRKYPKTLFLNLHLLLTTSTSTSVTTSLGFFSPTHKLPPKSTLSSLLFKPLETPFLFSTSSSYSQKPGNNSITNFKTCRRNITLLGEMEEPNVKESIGFNRKRAEGKDASDRPKNLQLKVRKLNPVNTLSYVQILGTGMDTQDTSPSVLLFFDKQRFIFNAGEGLQRFCTEHKIKLSKIDHIFLSRVCSETAGGLPGLLLTLAGMGDEGMSVNVWGPSDLKYLVEAMKLFIPNSAMVNTRSFDDSPIPLINDEVVKISAILLQPNQGDDLSVVYICELPEIQGKFDPKKAASLGLNPGPKYRELQLGISVNSDHQDIMVHPNDVLGPSIPGPIVLLVDCPSLSHLEDLSRKTYFKNYYGNPKTVNCIIHLSPSHVTNTTDYQMWMSSFSGAQHIMAGHELRNIQVPILKASAKITARLNHLCPQFFPAPGFWSLPHQHFLHSKHSNSISAQNLLKFHLRPYAQLGLDKSCIPSLTSPSEIITELLTEIPEITDACNKVAQLCEKGENVNSLPSCLEDITREDMEIVFLGTGSSQPSKYRNVSSIFINLFSKGSLLFDCGEGTLGQLKRRYGVEGADKAVKSLKCIWISHIHADHHTGLARILALRRDLLKGDPHEPIFVVGPRQLQRFLDAYQRLEDLNMQFLDCRNTLALNENENFKMVLREAGIEFLLSFPVIHCPDAYGVVLKGCDRINSAGKVIPGWKIVYSGDTRPCLELVKAACGATLLIHEATFEDGMLDEAISKNHSTTQEAIESGDSAGVYRIILTHFSQRYPKIPVFDQSHMHKTSIAFDLMSVNLMDLPILPTVLPYIKMLFKDDDIIDDA